MVTIKSNTGLTATISEVGAQLCQLEDKDRKYIYDNMEIWPKHSPVLFPFVGRMPDQTYQYMGKSYTIPLHGFAPTSMFEVIKHTANSCSLKLTVTDEIKASYPFEFEFIATYTLNGNTLEETFDVTNKDTKNMFYGFGSHPGFNVPIDSKLKFEDYYVEFPNATNLERHLRDENNLIAGISEPCKEAEGNKIRLRHNLFDDAVIILSGTCNKAVLKTDKDSKKIIVEYPDTPYCGIWHKPKMEVPFVCIEPWVSLPGHAGINEISTKPDFITLKPRKAKAHKLSITIA